MPLNEAIALMGGSGGVTMPSFSPTPQTGVSGTDFIGAQNSSNAMASNQYNQQNNARNAAMGGLFGLGGMVGGGLAGNAGLFT